jgi:hypothetical protein
LICEAMHRWDSAHRLRCALRAEVWRVSPSTRKQWVKVTVTLSPVHITSPPTTQPWLTHYWMWREGWSKLQTTTASPASSGHFPKTFPDVP